jgi:hypothetical protein
MPEKRSLGSRIVIAALGLIVVVAVYFGAYVALGVRTNLYQTPGPGRLIAISDTPEPGSVLNRLSRNYKQRWLATLFYPAGRIEALLTGVNVEVNYGALPDKAYPWYSP